jgi:elongation factor Ts
MSNTISATMVRDLRDKTGAGMMDCKKALSESNGDFDQAIEILRKKGLKDIAKRESKVAAEGVIGLYNHAGGQIAAIVELNCETDFVARGEEFQDVARGIAMHVAAMSPAYLSEEDVPQDLLDKEKEIWIEQLPEKQRPMADKIIPGKLNKFYEETVLLNQIYVKDDQGKLTVGDVVKALSAKVGEKVTVRRFQRFQVGEGIEKQVANLAAEVAATISGN